MPLFFHKHHPLFGLISSLLISIKTCAYVLLSGYALRGEALRPPPCTPPTRFYFLTGSPCYLLVYLSAYARQPARGPTMLAHLVAMLADVGLSCGNSKKHCKMQYILTVGGLSWGYVDPSWGYVGLS